MLRKLGGRARVGVSALLVAVFALGVGCHGGENEPRQSLEDRVRAYWSARMVGDDIKAYGFEDLAVTGGMSVNQYVRGRSPMLRYKGYELKSIEKEGERAKVRVAISYEFSYPTFPPMSSSIVLTDTWQQHDGVWYRHFTHEGPGARKGVG